MTTNADCRRTIIDPAPTPGCDYTCHVTAKGNVHSGLPQNCNWCRPFTQDGVDTQVIAGYSDPALARCGESGGIRPSVSERVAEIEAAQDHPAMIALDRTLRVLVRIVAILALIVVIVQGCKYFGH